MRHLIPILMLVLLAAPSTSQESDLGRRLDDWIRPLVSRHDLAGAILVRRQQEVLIRRAYGESDLSADTANSLETRFAIGSIAKQFTAAAILRLRDGGHLDLSDRLGVHLALPATLPAGLPASPGSITLRHLLTHRAGLMRDVPADLEAGDLETACAEILSSPMTSEPGTLMAYSNAGFVVLACVVEAVTDGRFEDYVRRSLFQPLGLSATDFWDGGQPLPGQALGYDPGTPAGTLRPTPIDNKRRLLGAAGVVSTVGDLVSWTESLVAGRALSQRSTREMLSDGGDSRGFAVGLYQRAGHRVIGHDGVTHGYTAFLEWYPDDEVIVAYAGNIRTSAFELLENAVPALVFAGDPAPVTVPDLLRPAFDASVAGSYRVHEELVIDVELLDTGLELRGSGGYLTPLLQIDQTSYWYPAMYALIEFERDAADTVTGIQWRTVHGQQFEIPKRND